MPDGARPNPPAHVVHIQVQGVVDSIYPWANGYWVRNGNEDTPSLADLSSFAGDFATMWGGHFARIQSSVVTMNLVKALYYGPSGADLGVDQAVSVTGTGSGESLPANVAMCISWKVQQRYRGGHARSYIAGVDVDTKLDAGTFKDTEVLSAQDDANEFIDDIAGYSVGGLDDLHLGVVSFVHNSDWRSPPVFRDFVPGGTTVDTRIDSQRRRLGRDR